MVAYGLTTVRLLSDWVIGVLWVGGLLFLSKEGDAMQCNEPLAVSNDCFGGG